MSALQENSGHPTTRNKTVTVRRRTCSRCRGPIAPGETVFRPLGGGWGYVYCASCGEESTYPFAGAEFAHNGYRHDAAGARVWGVGHWHPVLKQRRCVACGRVVWLPVNSYRECCSEACEKALRRAAAKEDITCAECGGPVTAARSDAKYCGSACRQKAYRLRVTDNGGSKLDRKRNVTEVQE